MKSPNKIRRSLSSVRSKRFASGVLLGLSLFLSAVGKPVRGAESAPDWLTAAGKADLAHFGDGSSAVVLGQWTDFTVDASGKYVMTERRALRVLDRRSADRYLNAVGEEDNSGKVTSIQTWCISPAGKVIVSGKKDIVTMSEYGSYEEFTDIRLKTVSTSWAEDGSLVGFEIISEGRIPINGQRFPMEEELPVRIHELHVSVPSGSLRWFLNHPEKVEVVSQAANAAVFRTENRSAIADEPSAPPFTSVAAMVVINYDSKGPDALQSWEQAGLTYHTLFASAEKPENDIALQVDTLAKNQTDTLSKIDALYTYVSRQIRYLAIEIGVGGFQPHPPADVYKNKYGDCKDKATLLISMLGKIGLRAYPALVGTRGVVEADPKAPTLATFDHVIVAFPVPAELRPAVEKMPAYDSRNQILWIDPTSETDPLGQLPGMDQGVFALISYPDRGDLQRIPEASPDQNGYEYNTIVHLKSDGTGLAEVEAKYFGVSNSRRHMFYRGRSQSEILKTFEEMVAQYVNQSSFQKASIGGVDDSHDQIVEKFSFAGNFSVASAGDSWFFQPQFLSGIAVPEVGSRPRKLPLDIGTPFHVKCNYREELPAGMKIQSLPDKLSVKTEFGELSIEYAMNGNVLTASENLTFSQGLISPEKYMEFRDFVNASIRAERQRLRVVTAAP